MMISPNLSASVPAPDVDTSLVSGLRLPSVPGLPSRDTPGMPKRSIPAPPLPGSVLDRADMVAVKAAQLLRTPEGDAWAQRMASDGAAKMWINLARNHPETTGAGRRWLNTALVAAALGASGVVTASAKRDFQRPRPFMADPSIQPGVKLPHGTSYPSGHASAAFAAARVIASLEPTLADEAYSLARQVAVSRVYAGVHYPSDVIVGALVGTAVGDRVLAAMTRGAQGAALAFA